MTTYHVPTTADDIAAALRSIGQAPNRWRGQNFLIDVAVIDEMMAASGLGSGDTVFEIGPGLGILTAALVATAKKVISVEIEPTVASWLTKTFREATNLNIIRQNVLDIDLAEYVSDGEYHVVANLPYQITGVILRRLLSQTPRPKRLTVMIQKEVAQRLLAGPGKMTLLGLSAHYYGAPRFVVAVPRQSFWPSPKVDSAVVTIDVHKKLPDPLDEKKFWQLAKRGFTSPRKQVHNNLAAGWHLSADEVKSRLKQAKISVTARPGDLAVADWVTLAKLF